MTAAEASASCVRTMTLSFKAMSCPNCGGLSKRHSMGRRTLRELGVSAPTVLRVIHAKYYCRRCERHFNHPLEYLAPPGGRFTHRARKYTVALAREKALTLNAAAREMWNRFFIAIPPSTIHEWLAEGSGAAHAEPEPES